jgi:alkylhydroperoxidase family enzyme
MAKQEASSPTTENHNGNPDSRFSTEEMGGRTSPRRLAASESSSEEARTWMDPQTMQRAEEVVDRLADNLGSYARWIGHHVLRLAARAREEAEDIWAEAESIRHTSKGGGERGA